MCEQCNTYAKSLDANYIAYSETSDLISKALNTSEISQMIKIELRLRKYLEGKWNIRKLQASKKAFMLAKKLKNPEKISLEVDKIMNKWSKDVITMFNKEIRNTYKLARIVGHKKATGQTKNSLQFNIPKTEGEINTTLKAKKKFNLKPKFDVIDEEAMNSLDDKNIFWVGEHYNENISDSIKKTTKETMIQYGQSPVQAGKIMSEKIKESLSKFVTPRGFTGTEKQYFEGLVANAMTVGRVYGQLRSFSEIGVEKYTIVNPGGSRICEVCLEMQGKEFTVQQGLDQIKKEYSAKNPKDIKTIHPWLHNFKNIPSKDSDSLAKYGLALPPYHYRCRCTVDISIESMTFENLMPLPFPKPN